MQNNWIQFRYLKLCIIIVMVFVFSVHPIFAAGCTWDTYEHMVLINEFFTDLWKLASWIWIVLWNLAGVLMTNTMVYWEFMGLDSFLWKIWQMTRSIANYTLWFLFIYNIFKYIFSHWEKLPIDNIKNILVSSVLIQASWFMVMVLVDLSTIGLATVSSFPAQVMVATPDVLTTMKQQMVKSEVLNDKKIIVINSFSDDYLKNANTKWYSVEQREWADPQSVEPDKKTIDSLLPSANNLWWPFIYLWFTALKAQEYSSRPAPVSVSCVGQVEKVVTNLILSSWILILYSLALVFLIILLVMRLWYIWIFIALSPLVILFHYVFGDNKRGLDELFSLKKSLALIFQPVFFALMISLMFIVVVMTQKLFSWSSTSDLSWWVKASYSVTSSSKNSVQTRSNSFLENAWVVSFYVREWAKSLKDVILSLIVLVLMWQLIKFALKWDVPGLGKHSVVGGSIGKFVDRTWDLFWTIWVIPTPVWRMWFNQIWNWDSSPYFDTKVSNIKTAFTSRDKSVDTINDLMWWSSVNTIKALNASQQQTLKTTISNPGKDVDEFVKAIKQIKIDNRGLLFSEIETYIDNWLVFAKKNYNDPSTSGYKTMNTYFWNGGWASILNKNNFTDGNINIKEIFSDSNWKQYFSNFYVNVLGWNEKNIPTYEDFMDKWQWRIPTS